jgi:hypothetical protein
MMRNTAASTGSGGYTFWHQSMLNVAPAGVTRETATPYSRAPNDTVDGQLQATYTSLPADFGVVTFHDLFTFTPAAIGSLTLTVDANYDGVEEGSIGIGIVQVYFTVIQEGTVVVSSDLIKLQKSAYVTGGGVNRWVAQRSVTVLVTVKSGLPVLIRANGTADPEATSSSNVTNWKQMRIDAELNRRGV